ncbi:MAG: PAS domain-containing protein [Candidatus Aphodosoma sp.]
MEQLRTAPFAITICDREGNILDMNDRSKQTYQSYGDIIGRSLFECHPPHAAEILKGLLANHNVNAYTIEKEGVHKLIYQSPWFDEKGEFGGYVELSLVIPAEMPHYVRHPKK